MPETGKPDCALFSVLIANYNKGPYIAEALKSVLQQSYTNWEVIIVDDASDDESLKEIQPFLADSRIKLFLSDKNHGCGFTKKKTVDFASGEVCGFLDADDSLLPDALQIMIDEHIQHPECGLIYSNHFVCDGGLNNPVKSPYTGSISPGYSFLVNPGEKNISHFASFKKSNYNKTEGISPTLKKAVDHDLYYKLEETGPVRYIDQCLYNYRVHSGGISTGNNATPALIQHYHIRLKALKKRLLNNKALVIYPKDKRLIKYQYARCSFYFNRLRGNNTRALKYLAALLLRWPSIFIRDVMQDKARRSV